MYWLVNGGGYTTRKLVVYGLFVVLSNNFDDIRGWRSA
jgi:hypothetical protein